jgi:hypothetical protein
MIRLLQTVALDIKRYSAKSSTKKSESRAFKRVYEGLNMCALKFNGMVGQNAELD